MRAHVLSTLCYAEGTGSQAPSVINSFMLVHIVSFMSQSQRRSSSHAHCSGWCKLIAERGHAPLHATSPSFDSYMPPVFFDIPPCNRPLFPKQLAPHLHVPLVPHLHLMSHFLMELPDVSVDLENSCSAQVSLQGERSPSSGRASGPSGSSSSCGSGAPLFFVLAFACGVTTPFFSPSCQTRLSS